MKTTNSDKIYPIQDKKMHYLCKRKNEASTTLVQLLTTKTIKIMDCIFKITDAVKKIGFVILLAELAVIAYMNVM